MVNCGTKLSSVLPLVKVGLHEMNNRKHELK